MSESIENKINRFNKEKFFSFKSPDARAMYLIDCLVRTTNFDEIQEIKDFFKSNESVREFNSQDIESIFNLIKNKNFEFDPNAVDKNSFNENLSILEALSQNPELDKEFFKNKLTFLLNALEFRSFEDYQRLEDVIIQNIKFLSDKENILIFKFMAQRLVGILNLEIILANSEDLAEIRNKLKRYKEFIKNYIGLEDFSKLESALNNKEKKYDDSL